MVQNIPLMSLALPYAGTPKASEMQIVAADRSLDHLDQLSGKKDLLLVDKTNRIMGWVPLERCISMLLKQLKVRTAQYETLLEAVDEAVTVVDRKGDLVAWNKSADRLYHYEQRKASRKPITQYFNREALVLLSVLKNGDKIRGKYNQPKPNVHVLINSMPVFMNRRIVGAVSVEKNINDLVKLNEELFSSTKYIHHLESQLDGNREAGAFHKIRGGSPALRLAVSLAKKVAKTEASVLLTGESGVGKELFAEAIHQASSRASHPFIAVNCGAMPSELFESELFGYEQGAFTGALKQGKKGRIDAAQGGTLFLDEIGEMPLKLQVKLLRVLQDKKYYRVGGNRPLSMNVRIIAATNQNLQKSIAEGHFRADLFYRLNVVSIKIPSLRERMEDIPELIQIYLDVFALKYQKPVPKFDPEVMVHLIRYPWPGNVRELRNTVERLMILLDGDRVTVDLLSELFPGHSEFRDSHEPRREKTTDRSLQDTDEEEIRRALRKTFGNKSAAAKLLGISRATLYNRMKKYADRLK